MQFAPRRSGCPGRGDRSLRILDRRKPDLQFIAGQLDGLLGFQFHILGDDDQFRLAAGFLDQRQPILKTNGQLALFGAFRPVLFEHFQPPVGTAGDQGTNTLARSLRDFQLPRVDRRIAVLGDDFRVWTIVPKLRDAGIGVVGEIVSGRDQILGTGNQNDLLSGGKHRPESQVAGRRLAPLGTGVVARHPDGGLRLFCFRPVTKIQDQPVAYQTIDVTGLFRRLRRIGPRNLNVVAEDRLIRFQIVFELAIRNDRDGSPRRSRAVGRRRVAVLLGSRTEEVRRCVQHQVHANVSEQMDLLRLGRPLTVGLLGVFRIQFQFHPDAGDLVLVIDQSDVVVGPDQVLGFLVMEPLGVNHDIVRRILGSTVGLEGHLPRDPARDRIDVGELGKVDRSVELQERLIASNREDLVLIGVPRRTRFDLDETEWAQTQPLRVFRKDLVLFGVDEQPDSASGNDVGAGLFARVDTQWGVEFGAAGPEPASSGDARLVPHPLDRAFRRVFVIELESEFGFDLWKLRKGSQRPLVDQKGHEQERESGKGGDRLLAIKHERVSLLAANSGFTDERTISLRGYRFLATEQRFRLLEWARIQQASPSRIGPATPSFAMENRFAAIF